ncbi:MAG: hypothetical protein ACI3U2_04470 [Anaerovibrio sp.]
MHKHIYNTQQTNSKHKGFTRHHSIKNFFTNNYDHPIFECGVQLVDMIYLQRRL